MNNLELEIHVIPVRHKDAVQSTSKTTDFFVGVSTVFIWYHPSGR